MSEYSVAAVAAENKENVAAVAAENKETVAAVMAENERRRMENGRRFDAVTGEGSVGARFMVKVADYRLPGMWLPETMADIPLIRLLKEHGNARLAVSTRLGRAATEADMLAFDDELTRLRMAHDFPFWAASFAYIKCKGGGEDQLFVLNRPQRILVETLERMRLANKPIRLILLKARQWGGSTCVQLYMAWLQLVHQQGLNSLIIAHQGMGSEEIKDMFDRLIWSYPTRLLHELGWQPKNKDKEEKKMEGVGRSRTTFRVPARNCKIKVASAERPDSCRGGDYNLVHCSEVGIWKKTRGKSPEQIIRSACSGVLLRPMTMIVYESTANGTGNFFHSEYEAATRGLSQFEPLFISWYDIDTYSTPFGSAEEAEGFAARLIEGRDSDVASSARQQSGAYLWWLWQKGATLEAINWYIAERSKYSDQGLMASEYPSDDVEAFVHSGQRVFDKYAVENLRAFCREPEYIGEIDTPADTRRAGLFFDTRTQAAALLRVDFRPLASGGWKIWQLPDNVGGNEESRYVVVVDVGGRSAKADWSVIVVFDRQPMSLGCGPEVVAQWRGHTDFDLLAWRAAMAAQFYDKALLVIESNTLETHDPDRQVDGDQSGYLLNRLRDVYPNLYARAPAPDDIRRGAPRRYGFHTNLATKPLIISSLVRIIREGMYTERDEDCLAEYLQYERRQNGSYGAIAGCHDDLLMTRAIGLHICFQELDALQARVPVPGPGGRRESAYAEARVGGKRAGYRRPVSIYASF